MKIAIIKYAAGNVRSVTYALKRLGIEPIITDDFNIINQADKVIFPGVGEASSTMELLRKTKLDQLIPTLKQPVLGICLGMQLMCKHTEEGNTDGMGIFDLNVKKFKASSEFTVPHMGWNEVTPTQSLLFTGIPNNSHFYFVHSYYAEIGINTSGTTEYIQPFSSALQSGNFYGVQFHPEKSAQSGQILIENFLKL